MSAETKSNRCVVRPWLIACDQSGIAHSTHYGFGTLWMPYDRRGDFVGDFNVAREKAGVDVMADLGAVANPSMCRLADALIDYFFDTRWLAFHCLVVERGLVDMSCHDDNVDLAQRKHFTMLLANKIQRALRKGGQDQMFRVWVAPIPSPYSKAAEVVEIVTQNVVSNVRGRKIDVRVTVRDPDSTPAILMCNLLVSLVMQPWVDANVSRRQRQMVDKLCRRLGWVDLKHDTPPSMRKFNIWKFHDPVREPSRTAKTRRTNAG
jgi:hypothetical protein